MMKQKYTNVNWLTISKMSATNNRKKRFCHKNEIPDFLIELILQQNLIILNYIQKIKKRILK